jgi:hypothetical protein
MKATTAAIAPPTSATMTMMTMATMGERRRRSTEVRPASVE